MKLTLADKVGINTTTDSILRFSTNLSDIASCIPTAQDFKQIDSKNFTINVTVGVAFIRGIFNIKVTLTEQSTSSIVYNIEGGGIGSNVKLKLTLSPTQKSPSKAEVAWSADMEMSGLISGVSESVIRKVSEDKLEEIISNVKSKLEKVK